MLKITSGKFKNTPFIFSSILVKPTSMFVKKIIFNWLGNFIFKKNCLDLYSGLGTLGFEAISRGCKSVTFVEENKNLYKFIINFKKKLGVLNLFIYNMNVFTYIKKYKFKKFDLIFIDAPYKDFKYLYLIIKSCLSLLEIGSLLYVESFLNILLLINYFNYCLRLKNKNSIGKINFYLFERFI